MALRALFTEAIQGEVDLAVHGEKFKDFLPVVALTDCKNLFDSSQREGGRVTYRRKDS